VNKPPPPYQSENALTPLDGRYSHSIKDLAQYFSEFTLNKYRLKVEIYYLIHLGEHKIFPLSEKEKAKIKSILTRFDTNEYQKMKVIEEKISHDVKAVEYYLRKKLTENNFSHLVSFVHLGLTSEDLNNLSYGLTLKEFKENVLEIQLKELTENLRKLAKKYNDQPMLGRTHGQPAVTTTVGKEFANYYWRLTKLQKKMKAFKFEAKCNGAVGNNNALKTVLPQYDWMDMGKQFVLGFDFTPNIYTTQILPYDNWLEFFQIIKLLNGVVADFSVNMWHYIMLCIFIQKKDKWEVGSSTMPQKINPIRFEQAEGVLQLANSFFEYFERKLIFSRLQRDLSDSSVRRSFGEAFGYTILGWKSVMAGLKKVSPNETYLKDELEDHWEILSEAIQTFLRYKGDDKAYEKLKTMTQGKNINKQKYHKVLKELELDKEKKLKSLTPATYLGYAVTLANTI